MQAMEFESILHNGQIEMPKHYQNRESDLSKLFY